MYTSPSQRTDEPSKTCFHMFLDYQQFQFLLKTLDISGNDFINNESMNVFHRRTNIDVFLTIVFNVVSQEKRSMRQDKLTSVIAVE